MRHRNGSEAIPFVENQWIASAFHLPMTFLVHFSNALAYKFAAQMSLSVFAMLKKPLARTPFGLPSPR
jgi:hypothetical protein